ncbi:AMP-binding protein, partial [Mycobacterium avium]
MSAERVAPTAARALVRSGLLNPPSPRAVLRLLREASRGGTNPYTLLAVTAARWPGRTAIIDDDGALSYRELQRATESLARRLIRDGVAPGRAVGVMCRNGRGFVTAVFAVALLGADVVPISTEFRSDALAVALRAHHISTVVADNEFAERIAGADDAVAVIDPATAGAEES